MTAEIATNEPFEARAGLTWQWRREDLADYPASTWTLKYWFKKTGSAGANFSVTASADGDRFAVLISATTSAAIAAGNYTWSAQVTAGAEAYEVDRGVLNVLPRYDQAANLDDRSHARIMLEEIEATLQGRASRSQKQYTIGNRSLEFLTPEELEKWRAKYRAEVRAEDVKQGNYTTPRLGARL
jgi:hypothetical protein